MKPRGLSGLKETSNGNVLSPTINPNQQSHYMERIPQNTCIYENLPHKDMPSSPRSKGQFHATIKKPKALRNQGTHNLSQFWLSRVVKIL